VCVQALRSLPGLSVSCSSIHWPCTAPPVRASRGHRPARLRVSRPCFVCRPPCRSPVRLQHTRTSAHCAVFTISLLHSVHTEGVCCLQPLHFMHILAYCINNTHMQNAHEILKCALKTYFLFEKETCIINKYIKHYKKLHSLHEVLK